MDSYKFNAIPCSWTIIFLEHHNNFFWHISTMQSKTIGGAFTHALTNSSNAPAQFLLPNTEREHLEILEVKTPADFGLTGKVCQL